ALLDGAPALLDGASPVDVGLVRLADRHERERRGHREEHREPDERELDAAAPLPALALVKRLAGGEQRRGIGGLAEHRAGALAPRDRVDVLDRLEQAALAAAPRAPGRRGVLEAAPL